MNPTLKKLTTTTALLKKNNTIATAIVIAATMTAIADATAIAMMTSLKLNALLAVIPFALAKTWNSITLNVLLAAQRSLAFVIAVTKTMMMNANAANTIDKKCKKAVCVTAFLD